MQESEAEYLYVHNHVETHAEEVEFLNGKIAEVERLELELKKLKSKSKTIVTFQIHLFFA